MEIIELLQKMIDKKYYSDKQEIQSKLNTFYAMSVISDEDYSDLTLKVNEIYATKKQQTEGKITTKKLNNSKESEDL